MINISNKIKSAWKLILCIAIFVLIFIASFQKNSTLSEINVYKFVDIYDESTWNLKKIKRSEDFELLFVDNVRSPYVINVKLPKLNFQGKRKLWIYAYQADNHGTLTFLNKDRVIGVVNNQIKSQNSGPSPKLSMVGEIEVGNNPIVLNIVGSSPGLENHYGELGLLILAPDNFNAAQIDSKLKNNKQSFFNEITIFLIISFISILAYKKTNGINFLILYAGLAVCLVCVIQYANGHPTSLFGGSAERVGIERYTANIVRGGLTALEDLGAETLPYRQINDVVQGEPRVNNGTLNTEVFYSNQSVGSGYVSSKIFSGALLKIQSFTADNIAQATYLLVVGLLLLFVLNLTLKNLLLTYLMMGIASLCSIFLSIRLSQGWDEFFINLRHAYNLTAHGVYSINEYSKIEGTVDFIPLIATALLGKLGINLIDSFIAISLLGNILIVIFSYLIVSNVTKSRNWGVAGAFIIGIYPNVIWVGASGFMAVLFTAMILGSLYFLVLVPRVRLGLILLGSLTLFRIEGVLLALIYFSNLIYRDITRYGFRNFEFKKIIKNNIFIFLILLGPFLLSCIIRKFYFGYFMPIPILFKNTSFDFYYFKAGLFKFSQLILTHDLNIILLLNILLFIYNIKSLNNIYKNKIILLGKINILMVIFVIPYYIGGGDWFPDYWNRYGMPFVIITVISFICLVNGVFIPERHKERKRALVISFATLTLASGFFYSAQTRGDNYITTTLKAVLNQNPLSWERVDRFASLGNFLGSIVPQEAVIASPEEATIMYYSQREMVGFLGVSNPTIASMPIQPMEPGDILHRKRGLDALQDSIPDVLLLYEPVFTINAGAERPPLTEVIKQIETLAFNMQMATIAYYRVGSYEYLKKMGYQHITIQTKDRIASLFVNKTVYAAVVQALSTKGYEYLGAGKIKYEYNPVVTSKYMSIPHG